MTNMLLLLWVVALDGTPSLLFTYAYIFKRCVQGALHIGRAVFHLKTCSPHIYASHYYRYIHIKVQFFKTIEHIFDEL